MQVVSSVDVRWWDV
jgi:hypothetical protein